MITTKDKVFAIDMVELTHYCGEKVYYTGNKGLFISVLENGVYSCPVDKKKYWVYL